MRGKGPEADAPPLMALAAAATDDLARAEGTLRLLREELAAQRERVGQDLQQLVDEARAAHVHLEGGDFEAFLEEPYCIVPTGPGEWRVTCPRWVDFHVGMLERSTRSYNVFRVNKYAKWLGNVPEELARHFAFKEPLQAAVQDGYVHVRGAEEQDEAWARYHEHLLRREGATRLRIKEGVEFKLISEMIADGILPFAPKAVRKEDLRAAPAWRVLTSKTDERGVLVPDRLAQVHLRSYQERAWTLFLEHGAIGLFWPPSAGKTFLTLYMHAHLKGLHLVVVPTATLEEQWKERIAQYLSVPAQREVHVLTYMAFNKLRRIMDRVGIKQWATITFDECHALPATSFSKFSTIPAKYRLGLSATPYREDGRTDLIFALTGRPVGLDWNELVDLGIILVPTITLSIQPDEHAKARRLDELLKEKKRTIVFCDSIDAGHAHARRLGCAFIHGQLPPLPKGARVVTRAGARGTFQRAEGVVALIQPEGRKRSIRVPLQEIHVEGREPFRCSASVHLEDGAVGPCGQLGTAYRKAAQLPPLLLSRTWYACPKEHAWRIDQYAYGHRRYPCPGGARGG